MYMYVCMYVHHMPGAHRGWQRVLDSMELKLHRAVIHHGYWKSNLHPLPE